MTAEAEKLEKRARNVLLHQLSRSMKTEYQLRQIMIKREIPAEIFEPVIARFVEAQLIDDLQFAQAFVASRVRAGKSVNTIRRELAKKGVSSSLIASSTEEITLEDEIARASDLLSRKRERMQGLETQVARRRLHGLLARRGFSSQVIASAMRQSGVSG